ncbi:hypothetical protein HDV62DRAFT_303112 [Trichoderma sp. SZMC 28011]
MLRWPFFSLPFQNGEKIRNSRVLAYHGSKPFPPRFFMPALPRPSSTSPPPPLGSFLQRKRERKCLSKFHIRNALYPYMYIMHIHIRHVAGGCNTATANRVGLQEREKKLSRNKQPRRVPTLFTPYFLTVLFCSGGCLNSADFSAGELIAVNFNAVFVCLLPPFFIFSVCSTPPCADSRKQSSLMKRQRRQKRKKK